MILNRKMKSLISDIWPGWDRTWLIPAGTNAFPLKVFNDVALPGVYTLALDGPSNVVARYGNVTVRGGESNAVAFPPGPTAETVLVRAEGPGEAVLTLSFQGTGAAAVFECGTHVSVKAWGLDIDVDSDNDGVIDTGDSGEDGYEDYAPGLLLTVTHGLAEGAGMRYPVRLSSEFCGFTGTVRLAPSAGCGQVRVWTNTAPGAAALTLPVEWDVSLGEKPPANIWVDGVVTGAVSLAYSAIRDGQALACDGVRLTVIPPASYAPAGLDFAAVWAPLYQKNNSNEENNVGSTDGWFLEQELKSQGLTNIVWHKDETGDTDANLGTCTFENYLNMRNAGVVYVTASHGEPG